jgi:hypothetical protein
VSKKIRLFSVGLAVFVVVLVAFAGTALASYDPVNHAADHSMITDATSANKHNVAPAGTDPCEYCHTPHGANGAFLWKQPVSQAAAGQQVAGTTVDAGYSSDIKPLCYSCHDGTTLVPRTSGPASVVSVGSMTAFSTNHFNHRTTAASALNSSGAKQGIGKDCDRCHDPHDDTPGNYLRPEYKTRVYDENGHVVKTNSAATAMLPYSADPANDYNTSGKNKTVSWYSPLLKGGNFCATCHEANLPSVTATTKRGAHPVYQPAGGTLVWNSATEGIADIDTATMLIKHKSATAILGTNPVPGKTPTASVWPKAGPYLPTSGQYDGTRAFDPTTSGVVTTKNSTAVVMCESCHAPHGANDGTAIADGSTTPFHYLNTMAEASLCSNCH